jgi:hypothetical protein
VSCGFGSLLFPSPSPPLIPFPLLPRTNDPSILPSLYSHDIINTTIHTHRSPLLTTHKSHSSQEIRIRQRISTDQLQSYLRLTAKTEESAVRLAAELQELSDALCGKVGCGLGFVGVWVCVRRGRGRGVVVVGKGVVVRKGRW